MALDIDLRDLSLPPEEEAAYAANPRTAAALRSWDMTAVALGMLINLQALRFVAREQVYDSLRIRVIMAFQMVHVTALLVAPALCSRHRTKLCLLNRCIRLVDVAEALWPHTGTSGKASPTNSLLHQSVVGFAQSATGIRTTMMTLLIVPVSHCHLCCGCAPQLSCAQPLSCAQRDTCALCPLIRADVQPGSLALPHAALQAALLVDAGQGGGGCSVLAARHGVCPPAAKDTGVAGFGACAAALAAGPPARRRPGVGPGLGGPSVRGPAFRWAAYRVPCALRLMQHACCAPAHRASAASREWMPGSHSAAREAGRTLQRLHWPAAHRARRADLARPTRLQWC